jgi:hypothetical protein
MCFYEDFCHDDSVFAVTPRAHFSICPRRCFGRRVPWLLCQAIKGWSSNVRVLCAVPLPLLALTGTACVHAQRTEVDGGRAWSVVELDSLDEASAFQGAALCRRSLGQRRLVGRIDAVGTVACDRATVRLVPMALRSGGAVVPLGMGRRCGS